MGKRESRAMNIDQIIMLYTYMGCKAVDKWVLGGAQTLLKYLYFCL